MPAKPRVPVSGGWKDAHGLGVSPESPDSNIIQSRLRPRITKNVANVASVARVKVQKVSTQALQHGLDIEKDRVETSLATEVVKHTEENTVKTPRKVQKSTAASLSVGVNIKDGPEGVESVQEAKEVTTHVIVIKDKVRGAKGKRTPRVFMASTGRSAYETYVKVPWRTTPYPDFHGPSSEDCEKVCTLLEGEHGQCPRPVDIPPPSLDVAGCGQVRQVIDAIVRTIVSANTTFENADKAIKRLYQAFGTVTKNLQLDAEEYPGLHHCLDYSKIRSSSVETVANAVKPAGNQYMRAGWIKGLLDGTYKINADRAEAFRNETPDHPATVLAADKLTGKQKQSEIWMFENGILHLEHYRALSDHDAMSELVGWDGVAVKTAACVMLFCMQKPIFALDTHCIRLVKWLGWAPHDATADEAFAHLDTLVPDHLKYPLHQLFIRHGQVCLKCKMGSNEGSTGWDDCVCPLEEVLKRSGKGILPPKPKKGMNSNVTDIGQEEGTNIEAAPPKHGRNSKQESDDQGNDSDGDYEEPPKKRARKLKKAAGAVPPKRQARGWKSVNGDTFDIKLQEAMLEPAKVDTAETMLNPEKQEQLAAKGNIDDDTSELSDHSDSEFLDLEYF